MGWGQSKILKIYFDFPLYYYYWSGSISGKGPLPQKILSKLTHSNSPVMSIPFAQICSIMKIISFQNQYEHLIECLYCITLKNIVHKYARNKHWYFKEEYHFKFDHTDKWKTQDYSLEVHVHELILVWNYTKRDVNRRLMLSSGHSILHSIYAYNWAIC